MDTLEKVTEKRKNEKISLYMRRALIVGILAGSFIGITSSLNYLLAQPDEWSRFMLHHFYNREEPIDIAWIGSSHVYCDVNPEIMNNLSGKNNFNLSTGSQSFSQSYLLLQEAHKKYNIKKVYLEMYYYVHVRGSGNSYKVDRHFRVWDYMENSRLKQQSIYEQKPEEEFLAVYMPYVRYRSYIFDEKHIDSQIRTKTSEAYLQMNYSGNTIYHENGYVEKGYSLEESGLNWAKQLSLEEEPFLDEAKEYLIRIIEYCQENEIELILFASPTYDLQVYSTDNYDNYVKQINDIASAYDLKYYDFNLCKEEYLPIQKLECFSDVGHLNANGAELFTPVLYDVLANDRGEYFYNSYKEKLEKTPPTIYGLITDGVDENDKTIYEIASNRETELEYRVEFIPNERAVECEVIQEYDRNKEFAYGNDAEGSFLVSARLAGETEAFIELRIDK